MRTSSPRSTSFCPGCDVKYLAPGRCDAPGGLYRPRALNPCGARLANGDVWGVRDSPRIRTGP